MRKKSAGLRWHILAAVFCGLFAGASATQAFYDYAKTTARTQSEAMGAPAARNTIQHAYAAAETYAALRKLGVPDGLAERTVLNLGYLTEYVEHYTRPRQDPSREIYKDLFNNMGGILAAQWAEACRHSATRAGRLEIVKALAARQTLPNRYTDPRVPQLPGTDVTGAIRQFRSDKGRILAAVHAHLGPASPVCARLDASAP